MEDDAMNGRDADDMAMMLAEQNRVVHGTTFTVQYKLAYRLRQQLLNRAPGSGDAQGAIDEFVAFAQWLEVCETLENTYPGEDEGGQPRWRSMQMAADEVTLLKHEEFRRVLYGPAPRRQRYLERWHEWALPALEFQFNQWRHLPASALPVHLVVTKRKMAIEPQYAGLLRNHGDTTLVFRVIENPNMLL